MTFAIDLQKFVEKTKANADAAVGRVVVRIAEKIDERSPVGDVTYWKNPPPPGYVGGHFRGNWQLGIDTIPVGEIPGTDPSGEATLGRIKAAIPDAASGRVYYLANNTSYGQALEGGHSRQAPVGLVGRTAIEFQQIVNEAVAVMK